MKERRRILFIAPLPPPIHGSSAVSSQILESSQIRKLFVLDSVNISTSRRMEEIGASGVLLTFIKGFRFILSLFLLLQYLLLYRYDICYCAITCYGRGFLKDAPFVLLCRLFGNEIVIHQHNVGMAGFIRKPLYRSIYPLVYKDAKVALLSMRLFDDIKELVKPENILVCPNGISGENILNEFKEDDKKIHILFLSNLLKDKGVYVLLDALKILMDKGADFVCDFVGSATKEIDENIFYNEVDVRSLNGRLRYHGRKTGSEKNRFWKQADMFVLPSFNEAFPLVILEAMSCGLPVVATGVGGIPDMVIDGENGFIVKERDATTLAYAIEKLLNDAELRNQMGQAGYEIFKNKYTSCIFEDNICNMFNRCING